MKTLNETYMCKLDWQLVANLKKLLFQVMKAKYKCGGRNYAKYFN